MNDTDARPNAGFFTAERAREILAAHDDKEVEVTFVKRTNGEWREMTCRVSHFERHDLVQVVEILRDAHEQGDMFGPSGPPTRVRNIPLENISLIETEHLRYTPNE